MARSESVRIQYLPGAEERLLDDEHLQIQRVDLLGVRQWHQDGWVYRLSGTVTTDHDGVEHRHVFTRLMLYCVDGLIVAGNARVFVDQDETLLFDWVDIEPLLLNCSVCAEFPVPPMTAEELAEALSFWDGDDATSESGSEEDLWFDD
jgi:hypothetical protein